MFHLVKRAWLQHALDEAPAQLSNLATQTAEQQHRPDLQKIKEAIIFTKDLILTYHAVILSGIVIFTLLHWHQKFQGTWKCVQRAKVAQVKSSTSLRQSSQKTAALYKGDALLHDADRDGTSSSGSSTLEGNATPPAKDDSSDSRMPLLSSGKTKESKGGIWSHVKALLIYQPSPVPFVNKVLPSNATSIFVLFFIGVNIFYMFYNCPLRLNMAFVFADRAGMLFVANLPLLYFLGAKNQPIKFLTGYSYESLNILHRRLGEILCILALLHTGGMFVVWYTILRPAGLDLAWFLTRKIVLIGLFAFLSYETLYLTSLGSFRQKLYELFLVTHVFFQAAALILLWFHHHTTRIYVGIALAIFLVDRLVFRFTLKTRQTKASLTVLEDGRTVKVSAAWPIPTSTGLQTLLGLTQNYKFGWKPTEHVFLTVPSLSRKHILQAHPFTIASAAPTHSAERAELDLIIRAQDGFSKDLVKHANRKHSTTIRMDGPYGSQHALDILRISDAAIIVAGGSGIAVAYPLISALLPSSLQLRDPENGQLAPITRKTCLIWIVHERSHTAWLGEAKLDALKQAGVDVILPPPTAEAGRPNVAGLVEDWIRENVERGEEEVGVVCSGPDGMNRVVRNACAGMVKKGWSVGVEVEKFGW